MQCIDIIYKKKEAVAFTSYSLCSYALREEKWGIEERSLAIVQRNNNICTRTFRQKKKKPNHVFHSGDGEQNGMTEFYLVPPSPARLTPSSVPQCQPYGTALFKFLYSSTQAFVCDCTVSAHCLHV